MAEKTNQFSCEILTFLYCVDFFYYFWLYFFHFNFYLWYNLITFCFFPSTFMWNFHMMFFPWRDGPPHPILSPLPASLSFLLCGWVGVAASLSAFQSNVKFLFSLRHAERLSTRISEHSKSSETPTKRESSSFSIFVTFINYKLCEFNSCRQTFSCLLLAPIGYQTKLRVLFLETVPLLFSMVCWQPSKSNTSYFYEELDLFRVRNPIFSIKL